MKFLLLALVALFIFSSCEEENKQAPIKDDTKGADQISYNFTTYFIDSNYTKAKLSSFRARMYSNQKLTFLDSNVKVEFFSKFTGKRVSIMTADSVRINDETRNMIAYGKVFVLSDSTGAKLSGTELSWNQSTQKINSSKYVTYSSSIERISGWGFESDLNLENYRFTRVSGEQK